MKPFTRESKPEIGMIIALGALLLVGCFAVASASYPTARSSDSSFRFISRHLVFIAIAGFLFWQVSRSRARQWKRWAWFTFGAFLFLNILVLLPGVGKTAGGATRWIDLKFFQLQPSELLKIGMPLALAALFSDLPGAARRLWPNFCWGALLVLFCSAVVALQRDLGTAIMMMAIGGAVIYAAGARKRHLAMVGGVLAFAVILMIMLEPYRIDRVNAWTDPWGHKSDEAYQVVQSYYAFGQGGLAGKGLGQGVAKHFLPAPHTDFVFATVAEETGIIGVSVLIGLFVWLTWMCIRVASRSRTTFGRLASIGLITYIGGQAALNIGVTTGVFPCTGIPLPFISYGGTSLISSVLAVAILYTFSRDTVRVLQENHDDDNGDGRGHWGPHLSGPGSGNSRKGNQSRRTTAVRR